MDLEKSGASLLPAGSRSTIPDRKKKKRRKEKKKNCLTNKNFLSLEWGICFPLSDLHAMFLSYTQLSDLLVTDLTSK